jgi:mannan endo-1,4-beta-mannosidase
VNRVHWDNGSGHYIPQSKANAVRWITPMGSAASVFVTQLQSENINNKIVPIPGCWSGTGSTSTSTLQTCVNYWVNNASAYTGIDKYSIVNIANEWGPTNTKDPGGTDTNGAAWASAYKSAIGQLRAAGYHGLLMIDSGGYGKSWHDIIDQGANVLASDPQKNIVFSVHLYDFAAQSPSQLASMFAALNATGLPYVIGEFGPAGLNGSKATPLQIMTAATNAGVGWMGWAWDDNNLSGCMANDSWFSMVYNPCGDQSNFATSLTNFGRTVVEDATYGIQATAVPATAFP